MSIVRLSQVLVILSILLSFLVHTGLLIGYNYLPSWDPDKTESETIEFEVLSKNPPSKRLPKNFIKDFDLNQKMETTKKKALYLSRKTRRVKKQTVARNNGITKNRAEKIAKKKAQRNKRKTKKQKNISKLAKDKSGLFPSYIGQNLEPTKSKNYQTGINLTQQSVSTISTYIPNVDKASITAIDTDKGALKYYTFYMRLHDQLYPRWSQNIKYVLGMITPKTYNYLTLRPRITTLEVILNSKGEYLGHIIVKSSGNKKIDFAATDAFRRAAPFVNPPKDLIEDDERIYIPFNFRLELSGRYYARDN